jgi:hypothetical protein
MTRRHISETTWAKSHNPATVAADPDAPRRVFDIEHAKAAAYLHGGPVSGRPISSDDHQSQTTAFGRTLTPSHQYQDGVVVPQAAPDVPEMSNEPQGAQAYYQGTRFARRRVQGVDSFD